MLDPSYEPSQKHESDLLKSSTNTKGCHRGETMSYKVIHLIAGCRTDMLLFHITVSRKIGIIFRHESIRYGNSFRK